MNEIIKFSDCEIESSMLLDREFQGVNPIGWQLVVFPLGTEYDLFKAKTIIKDWLQENTKKKYSIFCFSKQIADSYEYVFFLYLYFEDENDALFTKIIGYNHIKEIIEND